MLLHNQTEADFSLKDLETIFTPLCSTDEDVTQQACRSFVQLMIPKSKGERFLRKTRICAQRIADINVPPGTCIRVNNKKHNLYPSPREMIRKRCEAFLHQEFKYDLVNFNSEHFATFIRYGQPGRLNNEWQKIFNYCHLIF